MVSGRSRGERGWPPGAGASQKGEPPLASLVANRLFVDGCLGFERFLYRLWRRRWRWHYAEQSRNTGRHIDHFDLRHCNREQFTANCKYSADCAVGRAGGGKRFGTRSVFLTISYCGPFGSCDHRGYVLSVWPGLHGISGNLPGLDPPTGQLTENEFPGSTPSRGWRHATLHCGYKDPFQHRLVNCWNEVGEEANLGDVAGSASRERRVNKVRTFIDG
jgi:hypothetical protein